MSSSNDNKLCLDKISRLYPNKALYEFHTVEAKTRVEMRMIKASAFIRSTPEWADQLNDEEKRQEWTTQVKDTFNMADEEVEYIFEELKYYALLKENGVSGEELGPIDNLWTIKAESNCELAEEFKRNAAVLDSDFAQAESTETESILSSGFKALVDPFLHSFSGDNSFLFSTPVVTPEAALDSTLSRTKPGSPKDWSQAIKKLNVTLSTKKDVFDKRKVTEPVRALYTAKLGGKYMCWLPTDFHVNDDGSVTIPSYINNLHPVRYAALYQTISKIFAKFVPLLEQVTTDVIHPRSLRAMFTRGSCITPTMADPYEIYRMFEDGDMLPEEYHKYLYAVKVWHGKTYTNDIRLDEEAIRAAYNESATYKEPVPKQFCPSDRPVKPYSMRGLPLQASVEMASINLTPETPTHPEGEWQAVGRTEERVFAVGVYFYDVENIANLKLKFRDPVALQLIMQHEYEDFRRSHDMEEADSYHYIGASRSYYSQPVGEVEIKSGSYICYPNFYQTKMPSFELADPTRPGHVKYIAFYVVGPTQRLVSTQIVPPQQPNWASSSSNAAVSVVEGMNDLSLDNARTPEEDKEESVIKRADSLQRLHTNCNRNISKRFCI
ncbi:hypothetical protein GGI08_003946 [Coemansia sp. S2]|nr:hypothetical protein GGI14_003220 [Coemansia sp. S680]KAJ2036159.1 hypothetical protein H4S03_003827 [Coemansia sp. S3946]KAJ2056080.1 hypothetical protein GGI08_003946 [Coemansia sp. S2]KAJ2061746.1 hypothetical protein GGH13_006567 [Coemansia sp. S155-1]KAJ2347759.1 hypothetical protein GGH92_003074 [Coemansia sp. RSA 2673]